MAFAQTTYYVANNGNDGNTGRSSSSPFQTLAKVNSLVLQPGDQVLFQRNDTFRGTLQIRQSGGSGNPIVIDAYGSGNKPVMAGSVSVSNWNNIGNNVWQASCPACGDRVTGLYRNNAVLPLGRYPNLDASNKGYLTVQSHGGRSQLTSQQGLPANFTGGEAVFRPVQWILNRSAITGQNGNTLNLSGSGNYDVSDNWGFFIQNHPATLDQTGEWYYNASNKTIQLYDNQSNPNTQTITATAYADGINLSGVSNVTVRNLSITQTISSGVSVTNGSNLVFTGNDITQMGEDGILLLGSGNQVLMESNLLENINNNGVYIAPYQNVTFRNNTVHYIGMIPGRGKSDDGNYVGFQSNTTANTLITNNVFDNIGYIAVNFSNSTTVQYNQVSNFCATKSDGSGLYIWNGNQQAMSNIHLISNVVYNGIGATEGTPGGTYSGANGIYLDDCTTNVEVANNSVYNCLGYGIFLHGSSNISLTGNTVYNNREAQLEFTNTSVCQPRNNVVTNNIFSSRTADQITVKFETDRNDLGSFGQIDNNVYARPFEDNAKIFYYNGNSGGFVSLGQWQGISGKDGASANSPFTYSSGNPDDYIKDLANPSGAAIQVSLDGTYRDARSKVYSGQVTIPAYSSLLLFKDVSQPTAPVATGPLRDPENPANAVAGLDYGYYEGTWTSLPNFDALTAVKTGTINTPTLSVANQTVNYGLRYTGYISVPTDGQYTFYTSSDDGSKLLIGTTEVVNNDGGHAEQERSGTIGLKAGVHAITIQYYQGGGGQAMTVSYSGPGVGKQTIPDAAYRRVSTSTTTPTTPTTPTSSLRDPENPANAVAGLDYNYYEGSYSTLPNFASLTPVKTGTTTTNTLSVANSSYNYALRYTGYISVPTDGQYTFYTTSDDGTRLLIGSTEVVSNDGVHGDQEKSGTIGLKAGVHAITIQYFQGGGGQTLVVSYSGPGVGKQTIPDSAYRRVSTGTTTPTTPTAGNGTGTGLRGEYFNNVTLTAPIVLTRTDAVIDFDWGNGSPGSPVPVDNFSARWTGQVEAPVTGSFTFSTISDDGVRLWVNGTQVINNWATHAPTNDFASPITLNAGQRYDIKMEYFEGSGGAAAKLLWAYAGQSQQAIPQTRLYPATTASARLAVSSEDEPEAASPMQVYPVPARESVWIRYYAATAGEATIQLVNTLGLPVLQHVHLLTPGENLINVAVKPVTRGMYILTLTQDQKRQSRKVLLTD